MSVQAEEEIKSAGQTKIKSSKEELICQDDDCRVSRSNSQSTQSTNPKKGEFPHRSFEQNFPIIMRVEDKIFKPKEKQKALFTLFGKKLNYDGEKLQKQIELLDKEVLKTITKSELLDFCKYSQQNRQVPHYTTCRLYIPQSEAFDMLKVLLYNAFYPWDVEEENGNDQWPDMPVVHRNLAYATLYGHPKAADRLLFLYSCMTPDKKGEGSLAVMCKSVINKSVEEHCYYLKPCSVNRGANKFVDYWEMPREDVKLHFKNLLNIVSNRVQK